MYKAQLSSDGRNIDEVHLAASLSHPRIVKVIGVFHRPSLGTVLELTTGYKSLGKPPKVEAKNIVPVQMPAPDEPTGSGLRAFESLEA